MLPALAHRHPNDPQYQNAFSQQQMLDWVDHSADNLWVLCDIHHRHVYLGIHAITDPIWGPVDLVRDEFLTKGFLELAKGTIPNIPGAKGRTSASTGATRKPSTAAARKVRPNDPPRTNAKKTRKR
jgi:hypothetical protein